MHQLVVAAELTCEAKDVHQLEPMLEATAATLAAAGIDDRPETALADSGYWSIDNLTTIPKRARAADPAGQARPAGQAAQGRQALGIQERRPARRDDRQAQERGRRRRRSPELRPEGHAVAATHSVHPTGVATATLPGADDLPSCCLSATPWYESRTAVIGLASVPALRHGRSGAAPCGTILEHRQPPGPADPLGDHGGRHRRPPGSSSRIRGSTASTIDPVVGRSYFGGPSAANAPLPPQLDSSQGPGRGQLSAAGRESVFTRRRHVANARGFSPQPVRSPPQSTRSGPDPRTVSPRVTGACQPPLDTSARKSLRCLRWVDRLVDPGSCSSRRGPRRGCWRRSSPCRPAWHPERRVARGRRSGRLASCGAGGEGPDDPWPTTGPSPCDRLAFGNEPIESPVLQLDAGAQVLGDEANLDLGLRLPVGAPPGEQDAVGGRADPDGADLELVAVHEPLVEATPLDWFQEDLPRPVTAVGVALLERPALVDPVGEQPERRFGWQRDAHRRPNHHLAPLGRLRVSGHSPSRSRLRLRCRGGLGRSPRGPLVAGERRRPERSRVVLESLQALGVDLVEATGPSGVVDHQPGVLEHLEVLGDGGSPDREPAGDLDHRLGSCAQALEDRPTGAIPKGLQYRLVRLHHWCALTNRA